MRNFLLSFFLLFSVWLLLNNNFTPEYLVSGALIVLLLSVLFSRRYPVFQNVKMTPRAFGAMAGFLLIFIFELIRSNIDVALRVLSPALPINPGIVGIKTTLKDPFARLLLANAITLTPGTFTLDVKNDMFYIHWIDAAGESGDAKTQDIVRKYEKYLEVIFG